MFLFNFYVYIVKAIRVKRNRPTTTVSLHPKSLRKMKSSASPDKCGENFVHRLAFFSSSKYTSQHQVFSFKQFFQNLFLLSSNESQQPPYKLLSSSDVRRLLLEGDFVDPDGEKIDLNDLIIKVGIYSSNMYSPWFNPLNWFVYHVFAVFETKSIDLQSSWFWSIDKNTSCIVIQRSRTLEPLFHGKSYPTLLHPKGDGVWIYPFKDRFLKEVFADLYKTGQVENNYHFMYANCQHLSTFILEIITGDTSWKGPMENAGLKKEESKFEETRNLGRTAEIEIMDDYTRQQKRNILTFVSTRDEVINEGVNTEGFCAKMLFRQKNAFTPLVQSIFEGSLLQEVKDILESPDYRPVEGELPLHAAAHLGRDDVVQYLLEKRHLWTNLELLDVLDTTEHGNLTALYQAVMPGTCSLETIKSLATERNINIADEEERMGPLHWAVRNREPKTVEYLVTIRTIDLNAQDKKGYTPLHWTTEKMQPEKCFENVIESLKTVENVMMRDKSGMTPLHNAIGSENYYLVPHLVTRNNVNIQDNKGNTPLHLAVYLGCPSDIFELILLESTIEPNIINNEGLSPLHVAAVYGKSEIITILLQNRRFLEKVDINLQDSEGKTVLHLVLLATGNENIIKNLLSIRYIDVNVSDQSRKTPLDIAVEKIIAANSKSCYYINIFNLLREHGAISFTVSKENLDQVIDEGLSILKSFRTPQKPFAENPKKSNKFGREKIQSPQKRERIQNIFQKNFK